MNKTSESCIQFIPPEIISHLWRITELYGTKSYTFFLSARQLGDRKVQDIRIDIDGFSFHHTIFGPSPVNWTVCIWPENSNLVMTIVLSEQARKELDKWTNIRSALALHLKARRTKEVQSIFLNKAG